MNTILTRQLMDAFHTAAAAWGLMPKLPPGLTSQYVHVLDAIAVTDQSGEGSRVTDLARALGVASPGITRTIGSLEKLGAVQKVPDAKDRRAVLVRLTPKGKQWYETYVVAYHRMLAELLSGIPEEDVKTTIATIQKTEQIMRQHPIAPEGCIGEEEGGNRNDR